MVNIVTGAPTPEHAKQLLARARQLADQSGGQVWTVAWGPLREMADEFIRFGADKVLVSSDPKLAHLQVEVRAAAVLQLMEAHKPDVVLIGDSVRSRDVAAYVSAKLGVGCGAQWTSVDLDGDSLVGTRSFYSGRSVLTERLTRSPAIATVVDRAYEPVEDTSRTGEIVELELDLPDPVAKLVSHEQARAEGTNLEDAKVVVSAGRGIKAQEDLKLVHELAEVLGGAVGCTRPIAADLKWLGDEHWIGLSGHKVKPAAYIGLGVSGQIQHVSGMRGSKIIVAVNKDEEAPLVQISDYAVVDDLYKVVPALIDAIRGLKGA